MVLLKTLLRMLLLPPGSLILVAAAGLVLVRNRPRTGQTLIALALAGLWLLSLDVVATQLQRLAEHNPALDPMRVQATDAGAIVILGGGGQRRHAPEYGGPAADPYLLERLAYGAWLARQTHLPVLVTGNGIEAEAMRATLAQNFGVETRWMEDRSRDTFENARNSVPMLRRDGIKRILLVSSAAHVWRGSREFAAAGVEVVGAPVHVWTPLEPGIEKFLPTADALLVSSNALHELIGEPFRRMFAATGLRRQTR
jgi:uncharacterized SAM-binding protein YcdF (DUF218 family)